MPSHKYFHFHNHSTSDIIPAMDELVTVNIRADEAETLGSIRCSACGHLDGLHNYHCCEFCNVEGCQCAWGTIRKPDPDWEPVKGEEVVLTRSPEQFSV